ncbi:hypothetical protein GGU11DRAFT_749141 [Lentinula aff. detonsa]|uniref:Uncharacterized protein n=1 Tax=Lentinula aff. detonsa TaxID=2804958 RepID=A0AA38KDT7_9AGAR|nr:hypothetical protein GGU10DRAFT_379503 [Lentinula aff. detonsa]KAJ3793189.1 hypothetical protein GGU11DRAFT_749141 [Lentinula aff. detonsa]
MNAEKKAARKQQNKDRTNRKAKFERRQAIASVMIEVHEKKGDVQGLQFWREVLEAVDILTIGGMSDEEEVTEENERVRLVKDLDFRHPDFHELFRRVDNVRTRNPSIFRNIGRKRMRRVYVPEMTSRQPPPNMPSSYYRQEYLDSMNQGEVPNVKFQKDLDFTIPR